MSDWQYTDASNSIVFRVLDDGSVESRSIEDRETAALLESGYVPLPYKTEIEILADKKAELITAVSRRMAEILQAYPCPLANNRLVNISDMQQARITANTLTAKLAELGDIAWDVEEIWTLNDGSFLPLPTPQAMIAFGIWVRETVKRSIENYRAHIAAIRAISDIGSANIYDVNTGWTP